MKKILVVDDDSAVRECLADVLRTNGLAASFAGDGAEAVKIIQDSHFDLALVDILLPGKGGWEILPEIRQLRPATALIAMTGGGPFPPEQLLKVARYFGADSTLEKPFTTQQLFGAIDAALASHEHS